MTTAINDVNPSFDDAARRTDPNGGIATIVEQLTRQTPELIDATVMEGNLSTGHRITLRESLPTMTWRMANEGIEASKSRTAQVDEKAGQLAGRSVVDPDVAGLGGNELAFRMSEDAAFLAAMGNEVATGIWYHNLASAPNKFEGLAPRLGSTSGLYGGQVMTSGIAHSGSDQASAYWIVWGPKSVYLFYPKGSKAGLQQIDMSEQMVADANGNRYPAYETVWKWNVGLCVEDYRQVVRVANIDTSAIAETGTLLLQALMRGYHQLRNPEAGRCALYVNKKVGFYLHSQAVFGAVSSTLNYEKDLKTGKPVLMFMGCPVRLTDSLLNTEDEVS